MTTILHGNIIHAPSFGALETVLNGYLILEDGVLQTVSPVLPEQYAACPVTDYGDALIMPSFADLHLHAPQYPMLGMGMDLPLLDWLDTYTFRTEDLVHGQLVPAGDVAAQGYPDAPLYQFPDGGRAAAQVHVGCRAVDRPDAGGGHGLLLPPVAVDAVGHEGAVLPEAVFVVALPVLRTSSPISRRTPARSPG